jgi:hypothetical protein
LSGSSWEGTPIRLVWDYIDGQWVTTEELARLYGCSVKDVLTYDQFTKMARRGWLINADHLADFQARDRETVWENAAPMWPSATPSPLAPKGKAVKFAEAHEKNILNDLREIDRLMGREPAEETAKLRRGRGRQAKGNRKGKEVAQDKDTEGDDTAGEFPSDSKNLNAPPTETQVSRPQHRGSNKRKHEDEVEVLEAIPEGDEHTVEEGAVRPKKARKVGRPRKASSVEPSTKSGASTVRPGGSKSVPIDLASAAVVGRRTRKLSRKASEALADSE